LAVYIIKVRNLQEVDKLELVRQEREKQIRLVESFLVNELDIASLCQKFESTEYFIPKSEKFFLGKDRNNVELWFEEV